MRESFVFHADFIDHLPEDYKIEWSMHIINYGIFEIEPEFDNVLVAELWRKIKDRIDNDRQTYEEKKEKNRIKIQKWRESHGIGCNSVTVTEGYKGLQEVTPYTYTDTPSVYESDSVYESEYDSVYESEYDSEYEYESVSDTVSVSDSKQKAPSSLSPSQQNYSKQVFNIFKEAGLPCSNKNELSFLQTDFKNAINFIHKSEELRSFTSEDIIAACKNYVSLLSDDNAYFKNKMNFFSLVKSKIFYNLMPGNFDIENFKKFQSKQSKTTEEPEEKKVFSPKPCPKCGGSHIWWSQKAESYVCDDCKKKFSFDEYLGDELS